MVTRWKTTTRKTQNRVKNGSGKDAAEELNV
jgi:hypothetical protein